MINQNKWLAYIEIQHSGLTNMFDLDEVIRLNRKMSEIELTKKDLHYIMKNYGKLKERYGIGGVNINIQSLKEKGGLNNGRIDNLYYSFRCSSSDNLFCN